MCESQELNCTRLPFLQSSDQGENKTETESLKKQDWTKGLGLGFGFGFFFGFGFSFGFGFGLSFGFDFGLGCVFLISRLVLSCGFCQMFKCSPHSRANPFVFSYL
jgi:hypothetical protein